MFENIMQECIGQLAELVTHLFKIFLVIAFMYGMFIVIRFFSKQSKS